MVEYIAPEQIYKLEIQYLPVNEQIARQVCKTRKTMMTACQQKMTEATEILYKNWRKLRKYTVSR